ncbi:hypothetical protein BSLG_003924 [Batrachochytrium salamandrivorans]|nr:hypothetical protein BSLG_003924 [Batrachochytrium salamandrivorans]
MLETESLYIVPTSNLYDPLYAIVLAMAVAVGGGNLLMIASVAIPMLHGDRAGRTLKIALMTLNIASCAVQIVECITMYGLGQDQVTLAILGVSPLTAFILGGITLLQLEIRFTFNSLYSLRSVANTGWLPSQKLQARIIVATLHLMMCWPAYVSMHVSEWESDWETVGLSLQSLLIAMVSFIQAILITFRLAQYYKSESRSHPIRARHFVLVVLLTMTFVMDIIGVAAYTWGTILQRGSNLDRIYLGLLGGQFAVSCLGVEVLCETASLLMMVHLVKAKHAVITPSTSNTTAVPSLNSAVLANSPAMILPHTFHSSLFNNKSNKSDQSTHQRTGSNVSYISK